MDNIKIHQAYFGEVDRSHSCIEIELNDIELRSFLSDFTDRPSAIPLGINLQPYISGTSYSKYYIFTKTFPDKKSSRPGMVFTHTLIISLEEFILIKNINDIFSLFITEIPLDRTLKEIGYLIETPEKKENVSDLLPKYIQQTAATLLSNKTPVIFCGELLAFEKTLTQIWFGLPTELRNKLKFRVSFTPDDIANREDLLLVYVQNDLVSKWNNNVIINSDNDKLTEVKSYSEKLLVGQNSNNPFLDFINKLNINLKEFNIIGMCDRAYSIFFNIDESKSDSIILLVRLLSKLSPDQNDGKEIKLKVLNKLKDIIIVGNHWNLKSLRNISFNAFEDGERVISQSIASFIESVFKYKEIKIEIVSEWINLAAINEKKTDYWYKTVTKSLKNVMNSGDEKSIKTTWKLINVSGLVTNNIFAFVSQEKKQEAIYRKNLSIDLNIEPAKTLKKIAAKRKWFLLHADSVLVYENLSNALKLQINLEKGIEFNDSVGVKYLSEKLSGNQLKELTISMKDPKLIKFLGEKSISNSDLLTNIDLSDSTWLEIWEVSLKSTKDIEYANVISEKRDTDIIFNHLIAGSNVPSIILELLSKSKYANLYDNANVELILDNLPSEFIESFIEGTTFGYIKNLLNEEKVTKLDRRITNKITSPIFAAKIFSKYQTNILAIIKICEKHSDFSQEFLEKYLNQFHSSISSDEAKQIGVLVQNNRLRDAAYIISNKATASNNWKFALYRCVDLLDFFTRIKCWSLGKIEEAPSDYEEWWRNFKNTVIKLYPNSNSITSIWLRAGGEEYDLQLNGTANEVWSLILHKLKSNQFSMITIRSLLNEINIDYRDNPEFKLLYDLSRNYIN